MSITSMHMASMNMTRLDSRASRLMSAGNGWVNPFCGLDVSTSQVVLQ